MINEDIRSLYKRNLAIALNLHDVTGFKANWPVIKFMLINKICSKLAIHYLRVAVETFILLTLIIVTISSTAFSANTKIRPAKFINTKLTVEEVKEAEQRLSQLGYWTGPIDGQFDTGSRQALIAFQKVFDRKRTGKLDADELASLRTAKPFLPQENNYDHIEINLDRQILYMVNDKGEISNILPISSGSGKPYVQEDKTYRAVTPLGKFSVYRKIKGWRKSPLGLLYYPNYFHNGIAIHGNPSVPVYPASHGCIRIPMFAAKKMSEMVEIGTSVLVYNTSLLRN